MPKPTDNKAKKEQKPRKMELHARMYGKKSNLGPIFDEFATISDNLAEKEPELAENTIEWCNRELARINKSFGDLGIAFEKGEVNYYDYGKIHHDLNQEHIALLKKRNTLKSLAAGAGLKKKRKEDPNIAFKKKKIYNDIE